MGSEEKEKALLELEHEMWRADREGDGAFYDRMLRDDALLISRYGIADKARIVSMISENRNPFTRTDLSEMRVGFVSEDTAYVTYHCDYTAQMEKEGPRDFSVLATSVYVSDGDGWLSVLHQQTPL